MHDSVHAALLFTTASVVIEDVVSVFNELGGSVTASVVIEDVVSVFNELGGSVTPEAVVLELVVVGLASVVITKWNIYMEGALVTCPYIVIIILNHVESDSVVYYEGMLCMN